MDEVEQISAEEIQKQLNVLYVNNNQARSVLGELPILITARKAIKEIRQHLITLGIEADWS